MTRRRSLLLAGAGAAAGAAGLAWQLRGGAGPGSPADADAGLPWSLTLSQPDGRPLALATLRGRPLLLNFWATWCPPCVREMPLLDAFDREHGGPSGWRVLGVAADQAAAVLAFLARSPVGYTIAIAGFDGVRLSRELGNTQGGLPYSVAFDAAGRVWRQHLGEMQAVDLATWAREMPR